MKTPYYRLGKEFFHKRGSIVDTSINPLSSCVNLKTFYEESVEENLSSYTEDRQPLIKVVHTLRKVANQVEALLWKMEGKV